MTENQKLREALLSDMDIAVLRMPVHMAFAGDMAQFQYHNRVQSLLNRIEALAMQPDVPETNFGKLREALQVAEAALSDIGDADREPGDDLAWCERRAAQNLPLIRQALALPTADHIPDAGEMVVDHLPDAGKMIETAAPVGELPELPEAYGYFDIRGSAADGYTADQMRAYARAALSAGDAVDAQRYRWLRDEAWAGYNQGKGFPHVFTIDGAGNRRTMLAEDALDASIDAAMRKGQL